MQATSIAKAELQTKCDLLEQKYVEMEQEIVELRYQNEELVAMVCKHLHNLHYFGIIKGLLNGFPCRIA